jgi:hypothetical protein
MEETEGAYIGHHRKFGIAGTSDVWRSLML